MHRLVINPGAPTAWAFQLKSGTTTIGRSPANDCVIEHPSVSGSHCQIILSSGDALIRDLGSTNGTCVNRVPVQEAALQSGQPIQLGAVEALFETIAPVAVLVAPKANVTLAAETPSPAVPPPALTPPPAVPPLTAREVGAAFCKFHSQALARFHCPKCGKYFCDLCVTERHSETGPQKFCRTCGVECVPVEAHLAPAAGQAGFFARLPGAFVYPWRGFGALILMLATLVLAGSKYFGGLYLQLFAVGYLLAYMQNVIHSTVVSPDEAPSLPDVSSFLEDILLPSLRALVTLLIVFGPAVGLGWYAVQYEQPAAGIALVPAIVLGCLYYPMAFLAVAMLDSVAGVNPLLVVPSILKVPLEYLVTLILLGLILGFKSVMEIVLGTVFSASLTTRSMSDLLLMLGSQGFVLIFGLYLLTVNSRILGLLYLTKKDKLAWLGH